MRILLVCLLSVLSMALSGYAATSITTRAGKGMPLTAGEMDGNLTSLRDAIDNGIAAHGVSIAAIQAAQASGTLGYATLAALNADLAHPANTLALVTNDGTAINNTYYIKLGASGSGSWQRSSLATGARWVNASAYADFATAVTAQGSTPATLVVSAVMPVTTAITIPSTVELVCVGGGVLNLSGAGALTGVKRLNPRCVGVKGDGTSDDTTALNTAIANTDSGGVVDFPTGTYVVGALAAITKPLTLNFNNSRLLPNTTGVVININLTNPNNAPDSVVIRNANIYPGAQNPANIIKNTQAFNVLIDNMNVQNVTVTHSVVWNYVGFGMRITNSKFRGCAGPAGIYFSYNTDGSSQWTTSTNIDHVDISTWGTGQGVIIEGGYPLSIKDSTFQYIPAGAIRHLDSVYLVGMFEGNYFEGNTAYDYQLGAGGGTYTFKNNHFGPVGSNQPNRVLMASASRIFAESNWITSGVGGFCGSAPMAFHGINNNAQDFATGYTGTWDRELCDSVRGATRKYIVNQKFHTQSVDVSAGVAANLVATQPLSGTAYDEWRITGSYNLATHGVDEIFRVYVSRQDGAIIGTVITDQQEYEIMTLSTAPGSAWTAGSTVTGLTSGATCEIVEVRSSYLYRVKYRNRVFTSGETLSNGVSTAAQSAGYPQLTTATGIPHTNISVTDNGGNYSIVARNTGSIAMHYLITYSGNSRLY